jgi:DUF4097 and DUF4098 domain-containing protein YvlB
MSHDIKILTGALLVAWVLPAAAADFEQRLNAEPKGAVEIVNVSGAVQVSGWDRPEVHVEARLGGAVQRVEVTSEQGRTVVKVVLPAFSFGQMRRCTQGAGVCLGDASADLTVQVPRGSRVDVSSVSASVNVTGVQGDQRLRSVSGPIRTELGGDDAEVKTVSGDVRVHGSGRPVRLHVSTISGDVHVEHVAGELEAATVSGSIEARVDLARQVRARTTSGSLSFAGGLVADASLDVQTLSGQLQVRAQGADGYQYDVSTFSGHIGDCFNVQPERTSRYGPGERLHGTVGQGSAHVSIKSLSGTVDLCDH